ncbi:MAG: TIGR03790 family protein [Armatimonadota bacterium]|nr:TIGR03790 family protein [Armatimonadota bacterium]
MLTSLLAFTILSCSPTLPEVEAVADPRAKSVLVVYNSNAPEAKAIAEEYVKMRGVPKANLLAVKVTTGENIPKPEYREALVAPIVSAISRIESRIDFILTIRGLPLRIGHEYGASVDASIMIDAHPARIKNPLDWMAPPRREGNAIHIDEDAIKKYINPYGGSADPFNSDKFAMYLCTRLEGYTVAETRSLIAHSIQAKPLKGPFLLDSAPDRDNGGYGAVQRWMDPAQNLLEHKGMRVSHDETKLFIGDKSGLMGYASWGSNDPAFALSLYRSIRFAPGGIAETFVSTSARTFRKTQGGQSLIADLISQGVTGVKGYVSEPYTFALCRVDVLFDRYTSGRNLAESFWSATPLLKWKDIVIGDPLCAPYAK